MRRMCIHLKKQHRNFEVNTHRKPMVCIYLKKRL